MCLTLEVKFITTRPEVPPWWPMNSTQMSQQHSLLSPTLCPWSEIKGPTGDGWKLRPHFLVFTFFVFLSSPGLHPWHMELPRLGVQSELQLPAYTTAMATPDPSHICDLHCSSWHCWILNPLSGARDQTCILMDTSQVHNLLSHNGDSRNCFD